MRVYKREFNELNKERASMRLDYAGHRDMSLFSRALDFATTRHQGQLRVNSRVVPYITHLIEVATLVDETCGSYNRRIVVEAALLHDILELTPTKVSELHDTFGADVLRLVLELTDDHTLARRTRRRRQISRVAQISAQAQAIKLADKISNVSWITRNLANAQDLRQEYEYALWAQRVLDQIGIANITLATELGFTINRARNAIRDAYSDRAFRRPL